MAFIKKIWKDRISQFPNRRTINDGNVTKQVTVGRDEGTITEPGDSFDATNMNDLEQRIDDAYGDVQALVGAEVAAQYDSANVIFDPVATPGHGTGFVVSSDYIANLRVSDLSDVTITTPTQGEALVFDADGNIVNGTVSTVGSIDDLNDVDTDGKANNDSLRYDSASSEWIAKPTTVSMTQAQWNAIVDKVAWRNAHKNTHLVITDAPNLNPTASDIEYSSGVTVKQAIDGKANKSWTYVDTIVDGGQGCDLSGYNEVLIVPYVNNNTKYNSFVYPIAEVSGSNIVFVGSTTHKYVGTFTLNNANILTVTDVAITVWTSCYMRIWAR